MPGVSAPRLPGVAFDVVTPSPPTVLPRMDIAAFVGFAACGPVGVPVAVEDPVRFRDVFGPDVPLAWDAERGETSRSLLGPAVEAFFRNGGRRCWAVRVAGEAETHTFPIPGLTAVPSDAARAPDWTARRPARARARCPGSWADGLRVGAVLRGAGLRPVAIRRDGAGRVAVEVVRPAQESVEPGDLVRVVCPEVLLFVFAETATPVGGASLAVKGAEAVWLAAPAGTDPEALVRLGPDRLTEATEGQIAAALAAGPSAAARLRFDLLAWRGTEEVSRTPSLAFHPAHPRFWGRLPSDGQLFGLEPTRDDARALWAEAAAPRVPFAGPDAPPDRTLPLGMDVRPDAARAAPPTGDVSLETALDRDGLVPFTSALFLDDALSDARARTLRTRAQRRVVDGQPLRGLHALFSLDEVTLAAVPDAVHRGWGSSAVRVPDVLPAPTLDPVPSPDARGVTALSWSAVTLPERPGEAVERYEVEESTDAGFESARVRYRGADTDAGFGLPEGPAQPFYYRVRAAEGLRVSAWSNTRPVVLPPRAFDPCRQPPAAPVLHVRPVLSPPDRTLAWTLAPGVGQDDDATAPEGLAFTVEQSPDPSFLAARSQGARLPSSPPATSDGLPVAWDGAAFTTEIRLPASGVLYVRIRATRGGLAGPWSNTVVVSPGPVETRAVRAPADVDASVLLDVHRALLRLCDARGDVFAVLSVPDHFERAHALAHKGRLTPSTADDTDPETTAPRVPPLTFDEERALSFGALYSPWLAERGPEDAAVRAVPPGGAVVGTMAEVALREGAWIAPANRPIRDVLDVEPADDRPGWAVLHGAQVNAVRPDPRGALLLSADTLSPDASLRPIHVRRLLSLLRRLALREGGVYAFEPNGPALQRRVFYQFDTLLADLYRRGAFADASPSEAFQVVTGASVNAPSSVDQGRLLVELRVAPSRPLQFLLVRLFQQDTGGVAVATA